jgi:hypothetical protein
MSVIDRIGVGGLWITVGTSPQALPRPHQEQPRQAHPQPVDEPAVPALVWRSVRSGAPLSRGRALTQQQAIHAILTHSRNEIIPSRTTPTRITYRTPHSRPGGPDAVTVYEGTRPGTAHPIPAPSHRDVTAATVVAAPDRPSSRPAAEEGAGPAGVLPVAGEVAAVTSAAPTVVAAQPQTPPVTPGMRYRVWHQPLNNVDHAAETFDDQFFIQTATLAEAVQLERVLEAYDTWADRNGEHDIEVWDGTAWTSDIDPGALSAAQAFLQRIYQLDDITTATTAGRGAADA